jgi:hypothetical protein
VTPLEDGQNVLRTPQNMLIKIIAGMLSITANRIGDMVHLATASMTLLKLAGIEATKDLTKLSEEEAEETMVAEVTELVTQIVAKYMNHSELVGNSFEILNTFSSEFVVENMRGSLAMIESLQPDRLNNFLITSLPANMSSALSAHSANPNVI